MLVIGLFNVDYDFEIYFGSEEIAYLAKFLKYHDYKT